MTASETQTDALPGADDPRVLELMHLLRTITLRGRKPEGLERLFRNATNSGALGQRHSRLLLSLALEGEATVGQLAARVGLAPATTSMLANELNRVGLLRRREDDGDRRRTILSLPEQHRARIEASARRRTVPLTRALDRLGPRRTEQLLSGLRVLAEEFGIELDRPEERR